MVIVSPRLAVDGSVSVTRLALLAMYPLLTAIAWLVPVTSVQLYPPPELLIVIDPAPLAIEIPEPAVNVAFESALDVLPINS